MRKTKLTAGLLTFSLLLAASAFAGNSNKGTLKVDETITVAGKQLPAGEYQVEWTGSGPSVEVSISGSKASVANIPAQLLPLHKAESGSGYSTNTDPAGNRALTGILFGGKKYQLSFGDAPAATATPSDKTQGSN